MKIKPIKRKENFFKKDKKGAVLLIISLIGLVVGLGIILVVKGVEINEVVGEKPTNMMTDQASATLEITALNGASKLLLFESIKEVNKNASLIEGDDYLGFKIINSSDPNYYPTKKSLENAILINFNKRLEEQKNKAGFGNFYFTNQIKINEKINLTCLGTTGVYEKEKKSYSYEGEDIPIVDISNIPNTKCKENACQLEASTAAKLKKAAELAEKEGYMLFIDSTYRDPRKQQQIFDETKYYVKDYYESGGKSAMINWLVKRFGKDEDYVASEIELDKDRCKCEEGTDKWFDEVTDTFVARPGYSTHNLGKAVDLKLYKDGKALVGIINGVDYYAELEKIMCDADFVRYEVEARHFEYGTERWSRGKQEGVCAIK